MRVAVAAFAIVFCGCASTIAPPRVVALSSPDIGETWHLHARDGTFVCELPCEGSIDERGSYLVVHEPNVWRIDVPSTLPGPPSSRVLIEPHVGKGSPALGTFGTGVAITGAATAFTGIALSIVSFAHLACPDGDTDDVCQPWTTQLGVGGVLTGVGALVAVVGVYLMDHNRAARSHIVVTPTSVAGRF